MLSRRQVLFVAVSLCSPSMSLRASPGDPANDLDLLLSSLKGKVVLLDFWASWCEPCRQSFPWMDDLQARHGSDGLVVLAVNLDHERGLAEEFLAATPVSFRIAYDRSGAFATRFNVSAMPSSFVIDRAGQIRERHRGFKQGQRLGREQLLIRLLKE